MTMKASEIPSVPPSQLLGKWNAGGNEALMRVLGSSKQPTTTMQTVKKLPSFTGTQKVEEIVKPYRNENLLQDRDILSPPEDKETTGKQWVGSATTVATTNTKTTVSSSQLLIAGATETSKHGNETMKAEKQFDYDWDEEEEDQEAVGVSVGGSRFKRQTDANINKNNRKVESSSFSQIQ